jgi:O-antigen ligase
MLATSMTGLFLLKKESAFGRAFTWKIALQTIKEHPTGVGLGNFAGSYGNVQATYFASGVGSEREEYIADGVYIGHLNPKQILYALSDNGSNIIKACVSPI